MLLPMADEDFVDVEGVAIALMPSLQTSSIFGPQLYTSEPDCISTDWDASLGEQNVVYAKG